MRRILVLAVLGATTFGCTSESVDGATSSSSSSSGVAEPALDERCEAAKEPYGAGAKVIASYESAKDFEVVCWIDGAVAKSPPAGEPFDRAVVGVRTDGTATLIQAGYRDSMHPQAP